MERAGLQVAGALARFLEEEALPGTGVSPERFWAGSAELFARLAPENAELLSERDRMQAAIDAWHCGDRGEPGGEAYQAMLREIGYLVEAPAPFTIDPQGVDDEVARIAGPQLVTPMLNARFLVNAANARWGSLYDALYGTDALGSPPPAGPYDAARGAQVIAFAKRFLDDSAPLRDGSHADVDAYRIEAGALVPPLADAAALVGWRGRAQAPEAIVLRHHGLHLEIALDRAHPIGRVDRAGVCDVLLESAVTTIADLEDSVAAVDAQDKVAGYANWLGLMRGDLQASFEKAGASRVRRLAPDRVCSAPDGSEVTLPGRSLLFVRNVGHLMTTPALRLPGGAQAPEGVLDGLVTALIGLHDLRGLGRSRNSRAGSIYIVKPKMHGPAEAAFAGRMFDAVEDLLGLERHTIKVGLMDEERRTSANLAACIHALRHRIVFINTGFLDRTGDEIHTSMRAGPFLPKGEIKHAAWIDAYEDRNVLTGLACGFAGRGQIGKGMWAAPDRMADMLAQKLDHPRSGATTAWAPSPVAATLHALHYHAVDVAERQRARAGEATPTLAALLTPALAGGRDWDEAEVRAELENNAQGMLGYVVRWVDQGVGCSKVPDLRDVGLMEDRATLRISSQHMANWLLHGVATPAQVRDALMRMARRVDAQNAGDPLYLAMSPDPQASLAFRAAQELVFQGAVQPNGYTEPLLHAFRAEAKAARTEAFGGGLISRDCSGSRKPDGRRCWRGYGDAAARSLCGGAAC